MNSPITYKSPNATCVIRIEDKMYDVTAWRGSHPGGVELMDRFHHTDATDVFLAFHSHSAIAKLKRMTGTPVTETSAKREQLSKNYRTMFDKMEADGMFTRNLWQDVFCVLLPCLLLNIVGTLIASSYPLLAVLLIGVGMQQGGWVAHDYCHARGWFGKKIGQVIGGIFCGMSADWWNHKHNMHHSFTNRLGVDSDIHNEPIIHIWFPPADKDVWYRRFQHLYYLPVYSLLFVSWRIQSIQLVLASKNWLERVLLLMDLVWLACLPWKVAIGAVLLSGWLVAVVVTCSHQAEDIIDTDASYNFVQEQYATTRGVVCPDAVTEYLFGGMQYQLEHHMFPTLPKYRYSKARKIVAQFGKDNGLDFKTAGIMEIMLLNYHVIRKYAQQS